MELKFEQWNRENEYNTPFKSHLYGIEITYYSLHCLYSSCLNRTFMELKFVRNDKNRYRLLFKSHLYGIEIAECVSTAGLSYSF